MIIELKNIKFYFLTFNNEKRKTHILEEFKDYSIISVESIGDSNKNKSGTLGWSKILDLACADQKNNLVFQPFVIIEDDVKKYREFPKSIEIPDDADILYIGLSQCGMQKNYWCNTVCYTNVNEQLIKTFNMLSSHGIIICSVRGLLAIQKCMFESYFKGDPWDIYMAQMQPFYNVYALRKPLVYQWGEIGGQETQTKIEYTDISNQMIDKWVNGSNISVITCHDYLLNNK